METLESLSSSVEARIKVERKSSKAEAPAPDLLSPSQWTPSCGVALIHADSESLLGNFREYTHPSGARRLVRETWPVGIAVIERVAGSWWLGEETRPQPREEWHTRKSITMPLTLEALGVSAPEIALTIHISFGGIARCELNQTTVFSSNCSANSLNMLVELPSGTNLLPVLSREEKIELRKAVGI